MATRRMTHLFGQTHDQAHMRAKLGVSNSGKTCGGIVFAPASLIRRVKLKGLAHVVSKRAGNQQVSFDWQLREQLGQCVS